MKVYSGGEGGIRTHGTVARTTAFKAAAFNHSATSPNNLLEVEIKWCPGPDSNRHGQNARGILSPLRLPSSATRACVDEIISNEA